MTREQAESLKAQIEEAQSLMIAYVTGARADGQPSQYHNVYVDLDIALEDAGYINPNPHKSLEIFWSFCGLKKLGTYADRRAYVHELYGDIILDLERQIRRQEDPQHWQQTNAALNDELTPVRRQWLKAKNFIYAQQPDYENSIKESINSIESVLKILLNKPSGTLGQLLLMADIDADIGKIVSKAYGLVSNKDFVRHGGTAEQQLLEQDAEFFLEFAAVSIVYLKSKLKIES